MPADIYKKVQNALWWITSIATSVVCCSVIFVLFASYLVDVRQDIKEGNMRINLIEEREDKILTEIELIRKHGLGQIMAAPAAPAAPPTAPATTGEAPPPASIELPAQGSVSVQPAPSPASVPSPAAPATPAAASPAETAPTLPVIAPPSMAPSTDKK